MKKPGNLQMDDERFGHCSTENWEPEIILGPPTQRFSLDLKESKRLMAWFEAAIKWAEWQQSECMRLEAEENAK